ncbi:hypothetical protein ABZU76_16225 [Amycolatopsis sp. NPDC005232]|uniref:hypothetical protein n=1 Tax=unclassified Amycolatopsis TaxID=2618356 RepID=UPI0033AAF2D5
MGRSWGFWVPLALLGFAELILAAVRLAAGAGSAAGEFVNLSAVPMDRVHVDYFDTAIGGEQFLSQDPLPAPTSTSALGWPIALALVVAIVLVGYARAGTRPKTGRFALALAGGVLAVPVLDLAAYAQFDLDADARGPALAAVGLVVLAGYERSLLVLAVTVGFVAVAMLLPGVAGVVSSAVVLLAVAFLVVAGPVKGRSRPAAANG